MAEIAVDVGADIRSIWTPLTENCFKRLKAVQLDALYKDLLDLTEEADVYRSFEKGKKGAKNEARPFTAKSIKRLCALPPEQKARIDAWVPDCF